jgi:glycosyltransferase involved in cell wall biosynthesis
MAERWLVIANEATNSGAPRMLLEVLRGVRAARGPDWTCEILLRRGGALVGEFAGFGPVRILSHPRAFGPGPGSRAYRTLVDRPWFQPRRLAGWLGPWQESGFDLVYNNTATNGFVVPAVRRLGCPILTHVHELGYALRRFNTAASLRQTLENSDHFLAVSPAVALDLEACGVAAARITLMPNFLPALPPAPEAAARPALRARLGLPPDTLVVAGCGHIDRLKGTDLFVRMAASLARATPGKIACIWIGGETDALFAWKVRRLVRRHGLGDRVRFVGAVPDAGPWLAASDVVAITSRVESFSLVALEAAALGRPVVGFADARGLAGMLGAEPDLLVPGFDAAAMAAVVHGLLQDSSRANALGRRLRARVGAEFLAGPRIAALLSVVDQLQQSRRT